jgi:hypothetical protein
MKMSISEIARSEMCDVALISRRIKALGLKSERGFRGAKLIDHEEYQRAVGRGDKDVQAATNFVELLALRGKLGRGTDGKLRVEAARIYLDLYRKASRGSTKADELLVRVEQALGQNDALRCRAVIIEGRLPAGPQSYVFQALCDALDCMRSVLDPAAASKQWLETAAHLEDQRARMNGRREVGDEDAGRKNRERLIAEQSRRDRRKRQRPPSHLS